MDANSLNQLIKTRRAVFPKVYNGKPISKEVIQQILENANWAPTHKYTEPWRFKVFLGESKNQLGKKLGAIYEEFAGDHFSPMKYKKVSQKPVQSACVIAICMQRDPEERIPEFEEISAVACAVQNMWLSATAYGIGAYWSTPIYIQSKALEDYLELNQGESCLGFFYMGYSDIPLTEGKRGNIEEKTKWLE